MSIVTMLALCVTMVATAFLSGIFGMAGGLILMGVLLALMSLPEAMALHAVTQMASNGWRGLLWWQHVRWRAAANFLAGGAIAFAVWSVWRYIPSKPIVLILLGLSPFLVRFLPAEMKPDPERLLHGIFYGAICMSLMLVSGASGPLLDAYFLGGGFERRQIVATKAVSQVLSHGAKFIYFGSMVDQAAGLDPVMAGLAIAASMAGTSLARPILERLTDKQFRLWARGIITTIAVVYLCQGFYLLVTLK